MPLKTAMSTSLISQPPHLPPVVYCSTHQHTHCAGSSVYLATTAHSSDTSQGCQRTLRFGRAGGAQVYNPEKDGVCLNYGLNLGSFYTKCGWVGGGGAEVDFPTSVLSQLHHCLCQNTDRNGIKEESGGTRYTELYLAHG